MPRGKPKGSVHKRTLEWRTFGKKVMDYGLPRALSILKKSKDDKFMEYFSTFLQYFQSKAKETVDMNINAEVRSMLTMPMDDLRSLIMRADAERKLNEKYGTNETERTGDG